jgi:hypothetical protein
MQRSIRKRLSATPGWCSSQPLGALLCAWTSCSPGSPRPEHAEVLREGFGSPLGSGHPQVGERRGLCGRGAIHRGAWVAGLRRRRACLDLLGPSDMDSRPCAAEGESAPAVRGRESCPAQPSAMPRRHSAARQGQGRRPAAPLLIQRPSLRRELLCVCRDARSARKGFRYAGHGAGTRRRPRGSALQQCHNSPIRISQLSTLAAMQGSIGKLAAALPFRLSASNRPCGAVLLRPTLAQALLGYASSAQPEASPSAAGSAEASESKASASNASPAATSAAPAKLEDDDEW